MPLGSKPECVKCGTRETPLWHSTEAGNLCNACLEEERISEASSNAKTANREDEEKAGSSSSSSIRPTRRSTRITRYCNSKSTTSAPPPPPPHKIVPKGKGRRNLFKKTPVKAPTATATPVTSNYVFYKGTYFQVGDIVSMQDIDDGGIYYAQIRGLLTDQYCEKSAAVTWLLPTTASPPPDEGFSPETYIVGPEEDLPRKLDCMEFVMHAPSDYYKLKNTPYPPPPLLLTEKGNGYIWTTLRNEIASSKRDWRGLAHLCELSGESMPLLTTHGDPSAYILTVWEQKQKHVTLKDFQTVLEEIERWDVFDDTLTLLERDANRYLEEVRKAQTSAEIIGNDVDRKVLTVGDLHRLRQGLENQYYDAFLLYADEDVKFATEMVDKLENEYNLKLCLKDRDLIGGVTFEHEAIMTLISERCNRLIVIMSPNFLKSSANKFFLNYAQALSIDKKQRKIVPCLYQRCQLPQQLNYMFILDYNRVVGLYDFWGKLRDSVEAPTIPGGRSKASPVKGDDEDERSEENKTDVENSARFAKSLEVEEEGEEEEAVTEPIRPEEWKKAEIAHHSVANKKYVNFLREWPKKNKYSSSPKVENIKRDGEPSPLTETVSGLPSLENVDSLETSSSSSWSSMTEKKQKTRFIDKCIKRVQLKKVLVKS